MDMFKGGGYNQVPSPFALRAESQPIDFGRFLQLATNDLNADLAVCSAGDLRQEFY